MKRRLSMILLLLIGLIITADSASAYYSTNLGRFISRDPIGYQGSKWNLYEYVRGKPILYVDPTGWLLEHRPTTCYHYSVLLEPALVGTPTLIGGPLPPGQLDLRLAEDAADLLSWQLRGSIFNDDPFSPGPVIEFIEKDCPEECSTCTWLIEEESFEVVEGPYFDCIEVWWILWRGSIMVNTQPGNGPGWVGPITFCSQWELRKYTTRMLGICSETPPDPLL